MNSTAYKIVRFVCLLSLVVSLAGNIAQHYAYVHAIKAIEILSNGESNEI